MLSILLCSQLISCDITELTDVCDETQQIKTPADSIPLDTTEETGASDTVPEELQSHETEIETEKNGIGGSRNPYSEIDLEQIYEEYIEEYTFFPMSLINYIGSENFFEWVKNSGTYVVDENGEVIPLNIVDCLRYFNISREEFENIYYGGEYYSLIYDIDIMYNGTNEEIREYFKDFEKRQEEYDKRINILDNKMAFRRNISNWTADENVIRKYKEIPITAWTFTDIIYDANIPREDVEAIFARSEKYDAVTGKAKFNQYDIDKIYKVVGEMKESNVMNTDFSSIEENYGQRIIYFEIQLIDAFDTNVNSPQVEY